MFDTAIAGSLPKPAWLAETETLWPRWRAEGPALQQAKLDATLLWIKAQEDAGLDIVTDGEIRRESYSNRFATALEGVDLDNPGTALDRSGHPNPVPRVTGPIRRKHSVLVKDLEFLLANTTRRVKITVPGPFTMAQQAQIDHYGGSRKLAAMDYATAVNLEIRDLFAAGADVVQIDEPYMQARPDKARRYGLDALDAAGPGLVVGLHVCGSLALGDYQPGRSDIDVVAVIDAVLTPAHKALLSSHAHALGRAERVLILGRTDDVGAAHPNQAIALARAAAVRDHLKRLVSALPTVMAHFRSPSLN